MAEEFGLTRRFFGDEEVKVRGVMMRQRQAIWHSECTPRLHRVMPALHSVPVLPSEGRIACVG